LTSPQLTTRPPKIFPTFLPNPQEFGPVFRPNCNLPIGILCNQSAALPCRVGTDFGAHVERHPTDTGIPNPTNTRNLQPQHNPVVMKKLQTLARPSNPQRRPINHRSVRLPHNRLDIRFPTCDNQN
jgi:hypothetical protein